MFAGVQRDVRAKHLADLMPPHARTIDDMITGYRADIALIGLIFDCRYAPPGPNRTCCPHAFDYLRAALTGALCKGQGDICRISLTILFKVHRTGYPVDVQVFIPILHLGRRNFFHRHAESPCHRGLAVNLLPPLFG